MYPIMLCDKCLNKSICKYRSFLANAPITITIESCERFETKQSNNSDLKITQFDRPIDVLQYKEPIDYSKFDIKREEEIIEEDEEKVFVDLSEDHSSKVVSISDLLLGDDE